MTTMSEQNLLELIHTRENSYKLFKYQMSQLTKEGKELYADYLQRNLTEQKIQKILETYFEQHYRGDEIREIVLLKKPFIKLEPLSNEEKHKANEQFLGRKYKNLVTIMNEVNNLKPSDLKDNAPVANNEPVFQTFQYLFREKDSAMNYLADLYSSMVRDKFVQDNTPDGNNINKWKKIFRGHKEEIPFENRIIWIGSNYQLKYFISMLISNKIVKFHYHDKWAITANCFKKSAKNKETKKTELSEYPANVFAETTVKGSVPRLRVINRHIRTLMRNLEKDSDFKAIIL